MARVTAAEVLDIMDSGCTASTGQINAFIASGTLVIDDVFSSNTALSDDQLKEIERWFVAHLLASTLYRTTAEEKVGDASVKYTGKWGMGLDSTPYGQTVKQLDTTGLMALAGKKAASIYAVKSFED
jgi:hypothetical protein